MSSFLKGLVSKSKRRFTEDNYDLDLTYISDRIIAMGFPSTGLEGIYRNGLDEVKSFFSKRHNGKFLVVNLCSERGYEADIFGAQNTVRFGFLDHNPPPLYLLKPLMLALDKHLAKDASNIAAVHCKAGKGRTGTVIACYMLHTGICKTTQEALKMFGNIRTKNGKGITIPSQMRYVQYYENCLEKGFPATNTRIALRAIRFTSVPHFDNDNGSDPYFLIYTPPTEKEYYGQDFALKEIFDSRQSMKPKHLKPGQKVELQPFNVVLEGDAKLVFWDYDQWSANDHMFDCWLNTNFVDPKGTKISFAKTMLDKAVKDKKNKKFDADFVCELEYEVLQQGTRTPETFEPANFGKLNMENV